MLNRLSLNRIGLNRIGLNRIGKSSGGSSDRPYIDPKVLDSLRGVWIMDQNTNESESRNIIKNKIADRGGNLELLNFAYKANSGYNGYPEDFTSWISSTNVEVSKGGNKAKTTNINSSLQYTYNNINRNVESFKVKISNFTKGVIYYYYRREDGKEIGLVLRATTVINSNGIIELPKSYNTVENGTGVRGGFNIVNTNIGVTIEQLPLYEGALVTDGKDDMIVSQKTVQEMLGGSKEITVVSMIHQIGRVATNTNLFTNCIQYNTGSKGHNIVNYQTSLGKTGIYGYSRANVSVANNEVVINNILGDKADYLTNVSIGALTSNEKFSVVGYLDVSPQQVTSVAVYWTFIANKVLTTDEINQIIGYYKLDKYVTPQVIYDVKRQGLTNDTPDADWYLKDFSKNGFDMTLYNFAKKLDSGIGKYKVDFNTWIPQSYVADSVYTSNKLHITNIKGGNAILYTMKGANAMKVKITGIQSFNLVYRYVAENDVFEALEVDRDGIYELPASTTTKTYYTGFAVPYYAGDCDITIEQIPDYEGALVFDAVDDYGQFVGDLGLKDYTIAVDRAYVEGLGAQVPIISSIGTTVNTPFLMEHMGVEKILAPHSFGTYTALSTLNTDRFISYQSTYKYNGDNLTKGTSTDTGSGLTIGRFGANNSQYAKLALWSLLLFPYSLSEFLLERQLKKYKLDTLYPDMVEFRPVISGNIPYNDIEISQGSTTLYNKSINKTGIYLQEGSTVRVYIQPSGIDEVSKITVNGVEYTDLPINRNGFYYADFPIAKSPQKISYAIDEYIRYEDIVQPYPAIINLKQDGKTITWGDKLKVGSDIVFAGSANLLPELYTVSETRYNGVTLYPNTIIKVEKSMVFDNARTYLKANEPSCILSPNRLRIPNSSYKILGYIPDLTGKGNHGRLNNFAYTEESGANEDGSIRFDGTDDYITIPTLAHGGKCVMMKVNWSNDGMLYDQRPDGGYNTFSIYTGENHPAYNARNNGSTYIDGILNTNIIPSDLVDITHNITAVNDKATDNNTVSPRLGVSFSNATFSNMSLYEFMLFPEIPSEDEIKKLNDAMGIEGGYVESPNYYWDAYGKKNTDTDRNLIADQVSKDVANALEVKNVAYNSESGYGGKGFVPFNGDWKHDESKLDFQFITNGIHVTKGKATLSNWFWTNNPAVKGAKTKYKITGVTFDRAIRFFNGLSEYQLVINKDGIYEVDGSLLVDGDGNPTGLSIGDNGWVGDCDIVIEQLTEYPNGLLLDGIDDHAVNTVIPAVTDYTYVVKRKGLIDKSDTAVAFKGNYKGGGGAFICDYTNPTEELTHVGWNFGARSSVIGSLKTDDIIWGTKTSVNGTTINPGINTDDVGLTVGKWNLYKNMVFYKMMLYTKTIDQLSINMLKNLFERDELIDVTNPIFKKDEL